MAASGGVLLVVAVFFVHGAHSSVPPKFIKAAYGVQKALYAKNFGYSLKPIPPRILIQAYPPKTLPLVGDVPVVTARQGRAYKPYYYRSIKSRSRRRKRPPTKRRRPSSYGLPVYATKYKNYIPSRRPPSPYRYKKKRRPYRGPPRRPSVYREPQGPPEFDEYEQEIPDDYDDYDHRDGDYSYFDIPSKRLPLEYDKEFLNRHADLYNAGFNPGLPRVRAKDVVGQYTDHVRTRVRYQSSGPHEEALALKQPEKIVEDSQESLWPGEVASVHPQDHHHHWHDSAAAHTQANSWHEDASSVEVQPTQSEHDWHNSRPPRTDNQWHVYSEPHQHPAQPQPLKTQQFQWPPRPTRSPDLRGWTTSLRPRPLSAAVAVPSRPVVPREQREHDASTGRHHPVYNWDPTSNTYKVVEHQTRPRYQAHYSENDFNYHQLDRKGTENHRSHRSYSLPDIGYGEGMEVVDDGVAGWKVKK